jgi:DNA-directed RNA polymerase specialized sigma24 family protein
MEESAFAAWYETTFPALWAYVVKSIGDATLADDIAQEAFVRLLQTDTSKLQAPQVRAYLYRIATNLMHDPVWRRQGKHDAMLIPVPIGGRHRRRSLDVASLRRRLRPINGLLVARARRGGGHREIAGSIALREKRCA